MGADFYSQSIPISYNVGYAVQLDWTGSTPVGLATLEISGNGIKWVELPDSSLTVSGSDNADIWNVRVASYPFVRVHYVRTSGSGTAQVYISTT